MAHPKWPNGTKVGSSVVHTKGTLAAKKKFSPSPILAGNSNSKVGHSLWRGIWMAYICWSRATSANPSIAQDTFQKGHIKCKKKFSNFSKKFEKFEIFEKNHLFLKSILKMFVRRILNFFAYINSPNVEPWYFIEIWMGTPTSDALLSEKDGFDFGDSLY